MKVVKIGKCMVDCLTEAEAKRIPNVHLGQNCRIKVPEILQENKKLSRYINNETMGALDNYAKHENLNVFITPLENDLFDDISVGVYSGYGSENNISSRFAMKIQEGKDGFHDFMKDLYTRVANLVNESKSIGTNKNS